MNYNKLFFRTGAKQANKSASNATGWRGGRGVFFFGGRNWYWDQGCDNIFVSALVYRPNVWFDQRFQFCYQYAPGFVNLWNTDILFRSRWNRDAGFRSFWFGRAHGHGGGRH
ncbi:hypothetical protein BB559_000123 [Furculomyces boomerangus]|uniref:Uncharacterized protein n=1 Tax=Furculomyces boomerangus TaxID=61424 RepID=A0A2T9Z696_9FUNG|nr:hypothetical protein BB559_000123 [Furculomyces boomerangus]